MGAAAVAIIIRREREIVAAFRGRGAISAESAVALDTVNVHSGLALRKLRDHAVIRPARGDTWYLDEPSWEATNRLRRRVAFLIMGFVVLAFLTTVLFVKRT